MTAETYARVSAIIARYIAIPVEKVEADSRLEDLGIDSLGALELIFQLEEEFKILVPNERASEFTTVRAVCDGIESLQGMAAPAQ
jgi:acyl carrier protein